MLKKYCVLLFSVLLGTFLILSIVEYTGKSILASAPSDSSVSSEEEDRIKVLTFLPSQSRHDGLMEFYNGLKAGNELYQGNVDISIYTWKSNAELTREEYELHIAQALQPDYVIISSNDTSLMDSGIPYLLYDGDIEESERLAYVGSDNRQIGYLAALQALELIPEGEIHAEIFMRSDNDVFLDRSEGFAQASEEEERLFLSEVYSFSYNFESGREYIRQVLENNGEINLLFCEDSFISCIAANVLENLGKTDQVKLIGMDLTANTQEYLEKGTIQILMDQDFYQTGLDMMNVILNMDQLDLPVKICNSGRIITKEDLA